MKETKVYTITKIVYRYSDKQGEHIINFSTEELRNDYNTKLRNYYLEKGFTITDFDNGFDTCYKDDKWNYEYWLGTDSIIIYDELPIEILI